MRVAPYRFFYVRCSTHRFHDPGRSRPQAEGRSGHPDDWLVAISGFSYLLALAFFRWRG